MSSMPKYLNLKVPAYMRMSYLREAIIHSKQGNKPPSMHLDDWRQARRYGFNNWRAAHGALSQGLNDDKPV